MVAQRKGSPNGGFRGDVPNTRSLPSVRENLSVSDFPACPTRARVQVRRLLFVLALHEGVPRAMDHRSSGCSPLEAFDTLFNSSTARLYGR